LRFVKLHFGCRGRTITGRQRIFFSGMLVVGGSERTVSRYLLRLYPRDQAHKLGATFLRNHRDVIAAMDFFTVPTLTFRVLFCFFVIEHDRRRILHHNVTEPATGPWIVQQLREAFPQSCPCRYAILDGDAKFGQEVTDVLTTTGMKPTRTSPASPWQKDSAAL
jgi:hypothetical protein